MTKKKKALGPKRKRMKRSQRLQNAGKWMKEYEGKNIVKSYAKWYGVNMLCAITELEILGIKFSEKRKDQVRQNEINRTRHKQNQMVKRKRAETFMDNYDSDETFAYIAGYTEGGIPFGITYEEMAEYETENLVYSESTFVKIHTDKKLTISRENDNWFSEYFDWESYFGHIPRTNDQEELINELNRFDILLKINEFA